MSEDASGYRTVPNAKFDPTDPGGTYRPDIPPSTAKGSHFQPLTMQFRAPVVLDLPDTPLGIFQIFVPELLVEEWVAATNDAAEALQTSSETMPSRMRNWRPTSVAEVYIFIAMVICMENCIETAIQDYWTAFDPDDTRPFYPWTRHMPYDRFQQLWRRLRVYDDAEVEAELNATKASEKAYIQVEKWSAHIQDIMSKIYVQDRMSQSMNACRVVQANRV